MIKIALRSIHVLCVCSFVGIVSLRQYYTLYRPESPQVELGRTVAIDANYGKTVFVTPREKRARDLVDYSVLLPVALYLSCFLTIAIKEVSKK
jgi:hypothetical protein